MAAAETALGAWTNQYIGIPFEDCGRTPHGWDCWGLVRYVYAEHLSIELPEFDYRDTSNLAEVAGLFDSGLDRWQEVTTPETFDVVLLVLAGRATHCGVYVGGNRMLHVLHGCATSIIRCRSHLWKPRGFFRWKG